MIKELRKRSVHIDAPVDKVFDYVKDPHIAVERWCGPWRRPDSWVCSPAPGESVDHAWPSAPDHASGEYGSASRRTS